MVDPHPPSFYRRPAETVARALLGQHLERRLPDAPPLRLRIVETEAYLGQGDRASHAWHGRVTKRNATLFEAGGVAYVYLIYGIHHCLNAVSGEAGKGGAVLIRAGEPLAGEERMVANRGWEKRVRPGDVAGGPGKLCQALDVDLAFDGVPLDRGELVVLPGQPVAEGDIAAGPRVGVEYAGEAAGWPLRFAERDNPHVSRPRL